MAEAALSAVAMAHPPDDAMAASRPDEATLQVRPTGTAAGPAAAVGAHHSDADHSADDAAVGACPAAAVGAGTGAGRGSHLAGQGCGSSSSFDSQICTRVKIVLCNS